MYVLTEQIPEQIPIFQEHLLCVHRTDNQFSRKTIFKIIEQIGNFQEGTSSEQKFQQ